LIVIAYQSIKNSDLFYIGNIVNRERVIHVCIE